MFRLSIVKCKKNDPELGNQKTSHDLVFFDWKVDRSVKFVVMKKVDLDF